MYFLFKINKDHKYDVPIFCINDPIVFETIPVHERNIMKQFEEEEINVKNSL